MKHEGDILIVGREITTLRTLAEILEHDGYSVRQAEKTQMAIDSAVAQPPFLIIVNTGIPEIDGFEVCRRLKEDERTGDIPIIFISSPTNVEEIERGFKAGCVDFIAEPYRELEVLSRMRTHTRLRRMQLDLGRLVDQRTSQLRQSQERYELAIAGSAAGLWDWDPCSETVFYSNRFKELLGYAPEKLSNRLDEFWDRVHPDDVEVVRSLLVRHFKDREVFSVDHRLLTKSGEYRWFHARGQALWDEHGEATRMSGSITDITSRKLAEEELAKSEVRFRELVEQSPLAIEILSPDGKITRYNSAWSRMWGVTEEEAAKAVAEYNMLTDQQAIDLGVGPLIGKAFAGEAVILPPIEYSSTKTAEDLGLDHIEGATPWIQCHLSPVKDENGEVVFVVNTYVDITALKRAETEARRHQDVLARLDRATSMGQLTGSIAHELNQPLTGILSNAQAAEMLIKRGRWDKEELAEILAEIVADTKRGGEVIHNLRELYREQKGEYQPVDINAVIEETRSLLHSEFVVQHITATSETAPSTPLVDGNRIQIQQVLVNLMMNGVQAMAETAHEDRRLRIETSSGANEVRVSVEDHGHGIDPEKIDSIFEPLATWKPGGTGMGLAISNSIIQSHGGRMWAENRIEGGARVGFSLPVQNEEELK